jgi:teichuronic acid biosynthesis glycosyltransferase TuaH
VNLPAPRDVVFAFGFVNWDSVTERGMCHAQDQLLTRLMAEERVGRLLVAEPFHFAPARAAKRLLGRLTPFPAADGRSMHTPLSARRRDPISPASVERRYRAYDERLRRAAERAGLHRPAVVAVHPLVAGFCPLDWAGSVTFYATDDWTAHPSYRRWRSSFEEAFQRVRDHRRRVLAVSRPLLERIDPNGPAAVVSNGIDTRVWRDPAGAPDWLRRLPRPLLMYVGSLDERIDRTRIEETAAAFQHGSVVLLGPAMNEQHLEPLRRLPNVHFHEWVPRREVAAAIAAADACLVPHVDTPLTRAMSPLKLYEYLAGGRPVAAVDLPPMRDVDDRVILENGDGFGATVRRALERGPASEQERRAFLEAHSWQRRHERILELVLS